MLSCDIDDNCFFLRLNTINDRKTLFSNYAVIYKSIHFDSRNLIGETRWAQKYVYILHCQ